MSLAQILLCSLLLATSCTSRPPATDKLLPLPGEAFLLGGHEAFLILPAVSGLIMAALFVYIFLNFGDLTGTTGGALGWILPCIIPAAAVIGWLAAMRLEKADPAGFARMGENRA